MNLFYQNEGTNKVLVPSKHCVDGKTSAKQQVLIGPTVFFYIFCFDQFAIAYLLTKLLRLRDAKATFLIFK